MERTAGVQAYYAESAERLGRVYESVSFESVHEALLDLLPEAPARALDIGAGTGRDAAALARRGFTVDAVEPVAELRDLAGRLHPGSGVTWRAGALPGIPGLQGPVRRRPAVRGVDAPAAGGTAPRHGAPGRTARPRRHPADHPAAR
nr:class I SAM-dependent methyltransferase [Streptomyces canus]